ncbi:uncharacterized protein LOC124893421, partial [Capsicum annuum]|uniref:uncharacterized protein LOC124893421 n=1 Tax=Capsicum annuum TaxID=4072 RepID=UPI001FB15E7D
MASTSETENPTVASISTMIDPGNPLFIHPSDSPSATLAPIPFDGVGYRSWHHSVLRSLSIKNKLGFINGVCKKPILQTSSKLRQWERCDDMVTAWILNSLAKDIANSV